MARAGLLTLAVLGGLLAAAGSAGQEQPGGPDQNVMKLGKITCYKKERRVEVPGKVCLEQGALEYLAVLAGGKEYESVLVFDCEAKDLNLALIVLGYVAGGGTNMKIGDPATPKGDPVHLQLAWQTEDGQTRKTRAEDLLYNQATRKSMRRTAWVFTGSYFAPDPDNPGKNFFVADFERTLIAVYRDPAAIFNSPLDTGADDIYYAVNKETCPAKGTAVTLIIEPAPKEALNPENLRDGAELLKARGENPPPAPPDARPPPKAPAPQEQP
jgi:hypothetical protein